eukprot:Gb_21399 [translate_table: standard]
MVKICCIGVGYVGSPPMAMIAFKCPEIEVAVVDISVSCINAWNNDRLLIFKPELDEVVRLCQDKNLFFSSNIEKHVADANIMFVSVNTPTKTRGLDTRKVVDLTYWKSAARIIVNVSKSDKILVKKCIVPIKPSKPSRKSSPTITRVFTSDMVSGEKEFVVKLWAEDRVTTLA